MILLEAMIFFGWMYLLAGFTYYFYSVVKSWEIMKFWNFSIKDGYISGIVQYPKWLLGWLEKLVSKVSKSK